MPNRLGEFVDSDKRYVDVLPIIDYTSHMFLAALAFIFVGACWGSSFFWIKIALREIGPYSLVAFRLSLAAIGLLLVAKVKRKRFPRDPKVWAHLILQSLLTPTIPFLLISWGEKSVDSGVAAVLNAAIPLMGAVFALIWLPDEKLSLDRVIGLVIGFFGVLTIVSPAKAEAGVPSQLVGEVAVLLATMLYALHTVYARKFLRGFDPVILSATTMSFGALFTIASIPIFETGKVVPHLLMTWAALLWMGVLGTTVAFILYYWLLNALGPVRAMLVNYLSPVTGMILGATLLGERLTLRLVFGCVLVFAGILAVNQSALRAVFFKKKTKLL